MIVVVHPATLKFSDAELETDYSNFRKSGALLTAERNFMLLNGVLYILFVASELLPGHWVWSTAFFLKLLGAAIVLIQSLAMRLISPETWVKHRFLCVALFRTARLLLFLFSVPLWISDPTVDARTLFKTVTLRTGLLVNVWYSLGLPLLFREHVGLHAFHVLITALVTSRPTCTAVLDMPASRYIMMEVWENVNEVLVALAGVSEYTVAPGGSDCRRDLRPYACEMLLIAAHVLIAFAAPTLLLWRMEVASRQSYIQEMNRRLPWRRIDLDSSWLPDMGRIVVFGAVSASACWVLMLQV